MAATAGRGLRIFLWSYLVVAMLGFIFVAAPAVLLVLLLFSFGLLFPLFFVPTLAIYLTALWPAVLARRIGMSWVASAMLGLICIAAVAFVPGMIARPVAV